MTETDGHENQRGMVRSTTDLFLESTGALTHLGLTRCSSLRVEMETFPLHSTTRGGSRSADGGRSRVVHGLDRKRDGTQAISGTCRCA